MPHEPVDPAVSERISKSGERGVLYTRKGRIAHLVLDRPDKLNAFDDVQVDALRTALHRFDRDEEAWVAVLSGNGRAFSAGADVGENRFRNRGETADLDNEEGQSARGSGMLYDCLNWKPVVVAAHGHAFGLGLGLVLEADIAVVADDLQMQVAETKRGLWGSLFWARLHFKGAGAFADDVALTGRVFTGREAADAGVVARAVPANQCLEAAESVAEELLTNPPLSVRSTVRARRYYMQRNEFEQPLLREGFKLHLSEDFQESALAFVEKRAPRPFRAR